MQSQRKMISGGELEAQAQLGLEVKALGQEGRQRLLREADVGINIDAIQALAIKADLSMPWYKLRILRRSVTAYSAVHVQ